jgi:hypothetical protein
MSSDGGQSSFGVLFFMCFLPLVEWRRGSAESQIHPTSQPRAITVLTYRNDIEVARNELSLIAAVSQPPVCFPGGNRTVRITDEVLAIDGCISGKVSGNFDLNW